MVTSSRPRLYGRTRACRSVAALLQVSLAAIAALVCFSGIASAQGLLVPSDERFSALTLESHRVDFRIEDNTAVTHVTHVFRNDAAQDLEATFWFAMPPGAATTEFALWMNGERIRGEVLPRDQARATYEAIVRRMRDPGLMEYVGGELFQVRIFPVPARGLQTVEIEYASVLPRDGTMYRYTYPLHQETPAGAGSFSIRGTVTAQARIAEVYSPRHAIDRTPENNGRTVRVTTEDTTHNRQDFDLYVGLTDEDVGISLLTYETGERREDGYFMMSLSPTAELERLRVLPKQVTLVVDVSGSMAGVKMQQAREALQRVVNSLEDDDQLNLVAFSSSVRTAFEEPVSVGSNRQRALDWISALQPGGNTNISAALERAFRDPAASDRPHVILFVTDGLPTEGVTNIDSIIDIARGGVSDGDRRVFAFGVGYDVNTRLVDGMARRGRGESGYVRPGDDLTDAVGTLWSRVGSPLLTQLAIEVDGAEITQMYPAEIPDLYRGGQVVLFGRYDASRTATITVRGRAGRDTVRMERRADFAALDGGDRAFIGNLWARRRIDHLMDENAQRGENRDRINDIVELATRWNIVTPYTSLLALDPSERHMLQERELAANDAPSRPPVPRGGPAPDLDAMARRPATVTSSGVSAEPAQLPRYGSGRASASDEAPGLGGIDGRATATRTAPAPAAAPAPRAREEVGRNAVEGAMEAQAELRDRTTVDAAQIRMIGGRRFARLGGGSIASARDLWAEAGTEQAQVDRFVDVGSDAWFAILQDHPELREALALSSRVRLRVGREVIETR